VQQHQQCTDGKDKRLIIKYSRSWNNGGKSYKADNEVISSRYRLAQQQGELWEVDMQAGQVA